MSLILKQEPANTIATPPAGKSTLFVNDASVMSVKSPDGNVTTFPTVSGSNTQVFYNNNGCGFRFRFRFRFRFVQHTI